MKYFSSSVIFHGDDVIALADTLLCSTYSFIKRSGGFDFTVPSSIILSLCFSVIELFEACFLEILFFTIRITSIMTNDHQEAFCCDL